MLTCACICIVSAQKFLITSLHHADIPPACRLRILLPPSTVPPQHLPMLPVLHLCCVWNFVVCVCARAHARSCVGKRWRARSLCTAKKGNLDPGVCDCKTTARTHKLPQRQTHTGIESQSTFCHTPPAADCDALTDAIEACLRKTLTRHNTAQVAPMQLITINPQSGI